MGTGVSDLLRSVSREEECVGFADLCAGILSATNAQIPTVNLALDRHLRDVIIKVVMKDVELVVLKRLSSEPLRSDPRNHTIPVLDFVPWDGFHFSVQARWYDYVCQPSPDSARSRLEIARQLLGDIRPENIVWNHVTTGDPRHSKFDFCMAYIDFDAAVIFPADNLRVASTGARPPDPFNAPEQVLALAHLELDPYDVCAADVCMLGNVLRVELNEAQKWYVTHDTEVDQPYRKLLREMTCVKPEERPTASVTLQAVIKMLSDLPTGHQIEPRSDAYFNFFKAQLIHKLFLSSKVILSPAVLKFLHYLSFIFMI
ncbi:hypothetical protein B0H16DRAFT_1849167 [Mycena metata]|uniref:Protein kinase domain-containing protein n=1 Tax=Mycena metata TaxID=1033252 RepID=A0AAD7IQV7_9AGAR|nr:hypothetical protein B0H16DRAFT_1849167 [Mycena metata]